MTKFLRGALVEYSGAFLGPIPNVVVFQFNPESLSRTINIPPIRAKTGANERLPMPTGQTPAPPMETLTITAHFSAADDLGEGGAASALPRLFGIGPQLAALEKMVYPPSQPGGVLGAAIDAIGDALTSAGGGEPATRKVPPERLPRLLFIWGVARVLPVRIQSLTITEQKFDILLNPVQAEVQIGLGVMSVAPKDDDVAKGALAYSQGAKDVMALANLAKAVEGVVELIPI